MYELENALDERDRAQANAPKQPVTISPSGKMIEIGGRSIYESDKQGILRLWTEQVGKCRRALHSINAEIAKAKVKR
jgi:hypothetical protein